MQTALIRFICTGLSFLFLWMGTAGAQGATDSLMPGLYQGHYIQMRSDTSKRGTIFYQTNRAGGAGGQNICTPPSMNPVSNTAFCNGASVASIPFSSSDPNAIFTWTNNNTSIGLAATGIGPLPAFTATNAGSTPITATITVTPKLTSNGDVYISNETSQNISLIDPNTNTVAATIPTLAGNANAGVSISPDNTRAYVSSSSDGYVHVINTATRTRIASINIGGSPFGISAGNQRIFVSDIFGSRFWVIDANSLTVIATITMSSGPQARAICLSPDQTRVYVSSNNVIWAYDAVSLTPIASRTITGNAYGLAVSSDGQRLFYADLNGNYGILNTTGLTTIYSTFLASGWGAGVCVNQAGTKAYIAHQGTNTLYIHDISNSTFVSVPMPSLSTGVSLSTDESRLYVTNIGSNNVTVLNTATNAIVTNVVVGIRPVSIGDFVVAADGCTGTPISFDITVNPTPTVDAIANRVLCNGGNSASVSFTGSVPGTVYNWTNSDPSIGLAASGSGNIPVFAAVNTGTTPVTATITVTPTYTNSGITCTGTAATFTVTVNPTPTVNAITSQTLCNGANTSAISFSGAVTGTVYNWSNNTPSIGLVASGTGNIAAFAATNPGAAPVVATITVTPSFTSNGVTCTGTSRTFTITVNPTPTVNAITSQTLCNGANTSAISFSGAVTGTVYNWSNNTPSIGLAASGTGNIAAFAATNTGAAPVVATITVTPSFTNNGVTCSGTPSAFTITVNPTPTVNNVNNQTLCNGASTTAISFTGTVTGTVYNWTNTTTSIGLAASGTGNIAAFAATNAGTTPVVATITVTPSFTNNGVTCTGTVRTFTITVNPTPTVNTVNNQLLCSGTNTTAIAFTGSVPGTVFNWTNSAPSIGIGASGTGDIGSFVATNTGPAPVVATITVTPTYTNGGVTCSGTPRSFTITVNPTPTINSVNNQIVCSLDNTAPVFFSSPVTGTTFTWVNTNTTIGLAANGSGPIFSFQAFNSTPFVVTSTITATPKFTNGGLTCTGPTRSFSIQVNPKPNVVVPADQAVCNGLPSTPISFTGFVTGTVFNWTNSNTSIGLAASGTGTIPSFIGINTGSVPVVSTITIIPSNTIAGVTCTGFPRTFTITVNPTPIGSLLPPATTFICEGSSVTLTATGGTTYQWYLNGILIPGVSAATYAATQPGVYTAMPISAFGCRGNVTNAVTLTLINRPAPDFSFDKYCAGFPTFFTNLSQVNGSGVVAYAWSFGDLGISTQVNPSHIYAAAGTYNATLSATPLLCPALLTTVSKPITIVAPPANLRYPPVNAVVNRDLALQARLFTGSSYQWLPAAGLNNAGIQAPLFNYNQEQQYRIRITTTEGCVVTDSLLVRIFPEREIYVAGGFTPNGDGKNDLIIPKLVGIKTLRYFKVYNRWGQIMFQTSIEGQGWDGKLKGVPQPLETYVWIAEGVDLDDKVVKRSGNFILFR